MRSFQASATLAVLSSALLATAAPAPSERLNEIRDVLPTATATPAAALVERQELVPTPPVTATAHLEERQDVSVVGTSSIKAASVICPLSSTDPATFGASGATEFLDFFLTTNGTSDWLFNMDLNTTSDGSQPSALNCKPLGGETCSAPTVQCQFFTPPELFFIRVAATNAHDFFTAAHETLQDVVIADSLSVQQILNDFGPDANNKDEGGKDILSEILKVVAPVFSMSDKVVKQGQGLGPKADLLGFIGGAIGLAGASIALDKANNPPSEEFSIADLTAELQNQLSDAFTTTNDNIAKLNSKLFGGDDDIDLSGILDAANKASGFTPDSSLQQITQIFSSGAFLSPFNQDDLKAGVSAGFQAIKQQMVGTLLAAQNFFVFVDTNRDENACNGITGSRFINGQCYTIERRTQNSVVCAPDSEIIKSEVVLKFNDPNAGYNIDLNQFYLNVEACNNGKPASAIDVSGDFPACAFGMPFVKASKTVCNANFQGLPANLNINADACNKVVCPNPGFLGACNTKC